MELATLLQDLTEQQGSDLFITVGAPPMLKRSGELKPLADRPLDADTVTALIRAALSESQFDAFQRDREANHALVNEAGQRFRISALYQRGDPALVVRRIEMTIPSLAGLGLPDTLRELAETKRGLILFVGGTGAGKSSSLAAMLDHRNALGSGHILTIEDPVEFVHPHRGCIVTQREVGIDTDSFDTALRNALRQAPDVILIGEIRTRETMDFAVAFAETGHLVLATLHANNANQALDRIINFFPADRRDQLLLDLSLNLRAVIAQQLLPRQDQDGRVAALEILLNTPLIQERIRQGEIHTLKAIMGESEEQGMQTFDRHLYHLYVAGVINYEQALAHADSANEVRLMIKLHGANDTQDPGTPGGKRRGTPSLRLSDD